MVRIELHGVKGLVLSDVNRMMRRPFIAEENDLEKTWTVQSDALVASSDEYSLKAAAWFFESFGWMEPNLNDLRRQQEEFLQHRVG